MTRLQFDGQPTWGIKDPLNLTYFEIPEEAYFVLNQLNGKHSIDDICRTFHERFRPRTLSDEEVRGFVAQLISQNLLLSEFPGYGQSLAASQELIRRNRWSSSLSNVLSIRFSGFDPDRLFSRLVPWTQWLFSPAILATELLLILSAITLVVVQFDVLLARLPDAQAILNTRNLISMTVLLAITKVLHEIGHGLTCKHFGGECHEMGVMLLVFTPTLYCNVTDVWMMNDKWKRIAVSLAGIWIELNIAAICTLLWWMSAPGHFHSICLNVMILCGLSTLLFNGNPLLRYDGYFALSDWLEIPNLQQQSVATMRASLIQWFLGIVSRESTDTPLARQWGLFAYGIASTAYRTMLTVLILWGLNRWLSPLGFGLFVQLFAVFTIGMMVLVPLAAGVRFLKAERNREQIDWLRFLVRGSLTLAFVVLLLGLPLPSRVTAGALAEDEQNQKIYVTVPGTLTESVRIGEQVKQGQVIATLDEPRLRASLIQLEGDLNLQRVRLDQLERRRVAEPALASLIPTARESVNDLEHQVAQRQQDLERLVLRAPRDGKILAISQHRSQMRAGSLPTWMGSALEERNRGSYLRIGTLVCSVGSDSSSTAMLVINQDDINLVRIGQRVKVHWKELPGEVQHGEIVELAAFDLESLSRDYVLKLNIPAKVTSDGVIRPVGNWYQAKVQLDASSIPILNGAAGTARIAVDRQSISSRLIRWMKQTFSI